jgi:hypothetical protein
MWGSLPAGRRGRAAGGGPDDFNEFTVLIYTHNALSMS